MGWLGSRARARRSSTASVRFAVRQIVESEPSLLAVSSHGEIPTNVRVVSLGRVT
jgi:hypothetical protein